MISAKMFMTLRAMLAGGSWLWQLSPGDFLSSGGALSLPAFGGKSAHGF